MQVVVIEKKTNTRVYYDDIVSIIRFNSVIKLLDNNGYTIVWPISDDLEIIIESLEWL